MTQAISKLDVVRDHIVTSIQMIAIGASPISTHVIVMACDDLLHALAEHHGATLPIDYRTFIRPDKYPVWFRVKKKAYNFFKHADNDPAAAYSGLSLEKIRDFNEVQSVLNIVGHARLGIADTHVFRYFLGCMNVLHPSMFQVQMMDVVPGARAAFDALGDTSRATVLGALGRMLNAEGLLPDISRRTAPLGR